MKIPAPFRAALLIISGTVSFAAEVDAPGSRLEAVQTAPAIPPRPADAPGGAAFLASLAGLSLAEREQAIAGELCRGNLPDFLRSFVTVPIPGKDAADRQRTAAIDVMPDYLAIGNDADFVRMPMTPQTAQRVADAFGCALPTRKMVDTIHREAALKLEPQPLTEARTAVATFGAHNTLIESQRAGRAAIRLISGIKKDLVITNRLGEKPGRVAIYGWHRGNGEPIQPLSIVHGENYVDYSHGVRLIRRAVMIDAKPHDIRDSIRSAELWPLFSDEGAIRFRGY